MVLLYGNRRNGQGFAPAQPHPLIVDVQWRMLRQQAMDVLSALGQVRALEILSNFPWEPFIATRGYRESAEILYVEISPRDLVALELEMDNDARGSPFADIAAALGRVGVQIQFIFAAPAPPGKQHVQVAELTFTTEGVRLALTEAESSIRADNPEGALDRLHTVVQGYLRECCKSAGIIDTGDREMTIQALWKRLNEKHPSFAAAVPHDQHTDRIAGAVATALDSLNHLRNRGSAAHPNDKVVGKAEAWLIVDFTRSLLNYIERRLQ
jgi:hypothetical protein